MRHDWCALVQHRLTEGQATAAHSGGVVNLGPDTAVTPILVGCWACEKTYQEAKGTPCSGQPPGVLTYVKGAGRS